jgi:hypothetical protein
VTDPILPGDSCPSRVSSATSRLSCESNAFFMLLCLAFFSFESEVNLFYLKAKKLVN